MARSLDGHWTDLWRELFDSTAINTQLAQASLIDWRRHYRDALVNESVLASEKWAVTVAVKNLTLPFTDEKLAALPIPGRWLRGIAPPRKGPCYGWRPDKNRIKVILLWPPWAGQDAVAGMWSIWRPAGVLGG